MSRISLLQNSIEGIYAPISDANDATVDFISNGSKRIEFRTFGNQDWFLEKDLNLHQQ